jgi:DNA-binding CsgD family transcriptional regulator
MDRLLAVLKPAMSLAVKVGFSVARGIANGLSYLGGEIVLFSETGRVLHAPPDLSARFGDAVSLQDATLSSWDRDANERLASAVKRAVAKEPAGERVARSFVLPRSRGGLPLVGQVVPITGAAHDVFMLARAALVITDPFARIDRAAAPVSEAFGLTGAEARMALKIAAGQQLAEIAALEKITMETARSRLKLVFAKTGTHRQTELALLVSSFGR